MGTRLLIALLELVTRNDLRWMTGHCPVMKYHHNRLVEEDTCPMRRSQQHIFCESGGLLGGGSSNAIGHLWALNILEVLIPRSLQASYKTRVEYGINLVRSTCTIDL